MAARLRSGAGSGYQVVRFDNRDVGRSTHMSFPAPKPWAIPRGGIDARQYHLGDSWRAFSLRVVAHVNCGRSMCPHSSSTATVT